MCNYKVIDFHTHPFDSDETNICHHKTYCDMSIEKTERDLRNLGVQNICGSIITRNKPEVITFDFVKSLNDKAIKLAKQYNGFYIPGIHIHPDFVKESILEVERAHKEGVKIIGELVPSVFKWTIFPYACKGMHEIFEAIEHYKMIVSFHGHTAYDETAVKQTDEMVKTHKNITFVGAHICDGAVLESHIRRLKENENYLVDLSGGGVYRHGVLRHVIDECGADRVLFGSDYPVCNPSMYVYGVAKDFLLSETEKKKILYENAKKILGL